MKNSVTNTLKSDRLTKSKHLILVFVGVCLVLLASACQSNKLLDQKTDFTNASWYLDSTLTFTVPITDTAGRYLIVYTVRNTLNFPSHNLFIKIQVLDSEKKLLSADLQELTLMDPETGYPFGSGMGHVYDHSITAYPSYRFPKAGTYTIQLIHYMRTDPVTELVSVGLKVTALEQAK